MLVFYGVLQVLRGFIYLGVYIDSHMIVLLYNSRCVNIIQIKPFLQNITCEVLGEFS